MLKSYNISGDSFGWDARRKKAEDGALSVPWARKQPVTEISPIFRRRAPLKTGHAILGIEARFKGKDGLTGAILNSTTL